MLGFEFVLKQYIISGTEIEGEDAIVWAAKNNRTIEGKEAFVWAIDNGQLIKKENALTWIASNNLKIGDEDPIIWAIDNNRSIQGQDPVGWAVKKGITINDIPALSWAAANLKISSDLIIWAIDKQTKIQGEDPLDWAVKNGITINNMPALSWAATHDRISSDLIIWAISTNHSIQGKDPIIWTFNKGMKIDNMDPILWAVTNNQISSNLIIWAINNNHSIEGHDPLYWAVKNGITINYMPALSWAVTTNRISSDLIIWAVDNKNQIQGQDPIIWTFKKGMKIDNMDPILWAQKKGHKIDNMDAVSWAIKNEHKIEGIEPAALATDTQVDTKLKYRQEALTKHLQDRHKAVEDAFIQSGNKDSGATEGYTGKNKDYGHLSMLKVGMAASSFEMSSKNGAKIEFTDLKTSTNKTFINNPVSIPRSEGHYNSMSLVNELMTADLYTRILYNRTPIITLVEEPQGHDETQRYKDHLKNVYQAELLSGCNIKRNDGNSASNSFILLRSKYLHQFETVSQFTGNYNPKTPNEYGPNKQKLQQVEGAEKLFAAMLYGGELDIHAGNIGVMTLEDGSKVYAKIDHGWSATRFFADPGIMLKSLANSFQVYSHENKINLKLDKFIDAINEIVKISDDEIESMMKRKVDELVKAGFNFGNLNFALWENDPIHNYTKSAHQNKQYTAESFTEHLISSYKKQKSTLIEVGSRLEIINKSNAPDSIKNGGWVSSLGEKDPIEWAIEKGYLIDNLNPIIWAIQNGKNINGLPPATLITNVNNYSGNRILFKCVTEAKTWADREVKKNLDPSNNLKNVSKDEFKLIFTMIEFYNTTQRGQIVAKTQEFGLIPQKTTPNPSIVADKLALEVPFAERSTETDLGKRNKENFLKLLATQPIFSGKNAIAYIPEKFPYLKIDGMPPAIWMNNELSQCIKELRKSNPLNIYTLQTACELIAAGAVTSQANVEFTLKAACSQNNKFSYPSIHPLEWAGDILNKLSKVNEPSREQLNLAINLIDAGAKNREVDPNIIFTKAFDYNVVNLFNIPQARKWGEGLLEQYSKSTALEKDQLGLCVDLLGSGATTNLQNTEKILSHAVEANVPLIYTRPSKEIQNHISTILDKIANSAEPNLKDLTLATALLDAGANTSQQNRDLIKQNAQKMHEPNKKQPGTKLDSSLDRSIIKNQQSGIQVY